MSPLDRLLAEAIPTGTFGGRLPTPAARPVRAPERPAAVAVDPRAGEHRRAPLEALRGRAA